MNKNKNNPVFAKILKSIYLPNDIIQEIFYRLPSKSVFRVKAVNKEWNSILSSAQFMHKHCSHQRCIRRVADDHLILLERDQLYHGSYNNLFNPKAAASAALENPHNCHRGKGCSVKPEILGSCNGLVALSLRDCYNEFILWTPVTKKHISIYPEDYYDGRLLSGLCYNASCNDYSVVLATVLYKYGKVRVSVVNFRTGRGKEVEKSLCFKVYNVEQQVGTVVCGVPHWLAFISEFESPRVIQKEIIYFDLADGVFRQMARPDHAGVKKEEIIGFGALNAQHQLGIVLRDCEYSDLDLWVMTEYGKSKSWTMMFTISLTEFVKPPIFVHLLGIMPTRELLMIAIVKFYDEFDDDVEIFRAMGVYHPVKRALWQKEVEFLSRRDSFYAFVTAYEPSVVSPPEPEIQDKITTEVAECQHCLVSSVSPPHLKILEKTKELVEDDHDESSLVWFDCEPSFELPPRPEMQDIETKELVWYDCEPSFGSPPRPEMQEIVTKELVKYDCEPSLVSPPRQEVQDVKTEELVEYEPSGVASPPQLEKEESEAKTMELVDCPKPSYRDILMGTLTK